MPIGDGEECDPWLDANWCDDGGDDCITSTDDQATVQGCGEAPGGPGGGGPSDPPTTTDPDTCDTGDPLVDDPDVSAGLQQLWTQSNPDANLIHRVEKAGWIVEYPAGQFSIMPFTGGVEKFGCGDYPAQALPTQGTVVGFVHTHPYWVGETITDCSFASVQTYDGTPSDVDRQTSIALGEAFGTPGPLPGYIIDKDGYYRFDGNSNTATPRHPRCGY